MRNLSKIVLVSLAPLLSFSNEIQTLSDTKQEIIKLKQKQIEQKEQSNKYDWVSDVNLNASISKDEEDRRTNDYYLSISQEIFNFGGIRSQIDYATQLKKMESLDLDINTKDDLNTIFSLLVDVKINDISLEQNTLNLKNSEISIRNKKSEYKAGQLDISDLNDAIMTKNELSDAKKELNLAKLVNINSIKKYTSKNYKEINIPDIKLMNKDTYIQNATSINYAKLDATVNKSLYKIKKSDYLPSLALTGRYGYEDSNEMNGDDYYNYGLELSMPLSLTASNEIEQSKLDYLISQKELAEEQINSLSTYEEAVLSINSYKDRITLAKKDIKLYDELLEVNEEEYNAGYKTIDDVETLKNSKLIRALDIKTYKLNIQKQILKLYFNISKV
ncbi:TolC family protein [Poseidonibacter lekithochrous]|uniref:TolC family protein n=1 Tax=Poseidonibacter TaxID=2321187 RepID=UPI001C083F9E|nr:MULTISPECIES: TolC family protein [Poseidonibacter]MBU3014925.1 TolC family protein [Poseidonibacter lekithochrous]MDO6828223.1 TolC family protein [Poseidonibacter sp. 1_MG-2023]